MGWNQRVKIKQRDITDCGAACLASVSVHHKLRLPVSRIRQFVGTDKKGTNVLGLVEGAQQIGFQVKAAKGPLDSLFKIPLPAIAHLILKNNLHHFVVIYKVTKDNVIYMDPGTGTMEKKKVNEFAEVWSGIIILLMPGEEFRTGNERISNSFRFWNLIKPHGFIMLQAIIAAVLYTMLGLSTSIYIQKVIDFVLVDGNFRLLNLLSIGMIVILFIQLLTGLFKSIISLQTGQYIDARLILGYYKHLLNLPQRFFDTMRVGEIVSRVSDAVKIRLFINEVGMSLIVNILIVIFSTGIMFLYYWKLALITVSVIPVLCLLYWLSNRINKKWQRRLMENSAELENQLVESLNAIGTIKRFSLEEHANLKTENRFIQLLQSIYISSLKGLYVSVSSDFITRLFTIIVLWVGSYFVINRELTPGELLSFYAIVAYFIGPVTSLIGANKSIQDALIASDRLFEIIDLETESSDTNKVELSPETIGDIHFHAVNFRYGSRVTVFDGLSLTIERGKATAVVGDSGSGKSTLLSLLQNLYPLNSGNITIGGLDLQHISNASIRNMIAVVPQQIHLFAGTIIDNIAIGDDEPDMRKVVGICQSLGVNEFIEKLPATYATILSEQGNNLSGGQRQRIALARALYRNPQILILDEATSSLDPSSEQKVQHTLEQLKLAGRTVIIITHRLSTIKNADKILVLREGKLVEQGDHQKLLALNGFYHEMWQNMM